LPDLAFSWRSQVAALSNAGYYAMAPEQRGYGLTDGLDDPAQYDMQFICDDLAGMLDAKVLNERYFVVMTGVVR